MQYESLNSISPLNGRYIEIGNQLAPYFSEFALIKGRLKVEIQYFIYLAENNISPSLSTNQLKYLNYLMDNFSIEDAKEIKHIEAKIRHDVKAVEYYIRDKIRSNGIETDHNVHIGLTSEDINNLVYSLSLKHSRDNIIIPSLSDMLSALLHLSLVYHDLPIVARTHGQVAVPTTMGKEIINFAIRISQEFKKLEQLEIEGKLTGAVGNYNAHTLIGNQNWINISQKFVESLGLKPNIFTTQILPPQSYIHIFQTYFNINQILIDLNRDMWMYIGQGIIIQKTDENHIGSSTMPQKVNPINFENSEGNCHIANSMLQMFCQTLPTSRLQRDLSDSTIKRNIGVAIGHSLLAYQTCFKGLQKIAVNRDYVKHELDSHWEVVTEGIQTILRSEGNQYAYELLKDISRGKKVTQSDIQSFIQNLDIRKEIRNKLEQLSPNTYIGLASELVDMGKKEILKNFPDILAKTGGEYENQEK